MNKFFTDKLVYWAGALKKIANQTEKNEVLLSIADDLAAWADVITNFDEILCGLEVGESIVISREELGLLN